jgi:hypothetical protein
MNAQEREAFKYYETISDLGSQRRICIDVTEELEFDQLLEVFGFERKYESDFETDEEFEEYQNSFSRENLSNVQIAIEYPCVMVSWLDKEWDRMGSSVITAVDYVSLSEFETLK